MTGSAMNSDMVIKLIVCEVEKIELSKNLAELTGNPEVGLTNIIISGRCSQLLAEGAYV